ncbi:MAG: TlpA disulfide reductase family protein, partial [Candidatus Binatia bacterium]
PANPLADFGVIEPKTHMAAPGFLLNDTQGDTIKLSDHGGEVVLLHFWATWCIPCRKEMPALMKVQDEYRDQGLTVLYVNVDRGSREVVADFMDGVGLSLSTLLDPDGKVRNLYEVVALSTTYIIGRDGKIIGRIIGERDWSGAEASAALHALLGTKREGQRGK